MWNFGGWMASGTVVNSGLRYVESLIAIEMRQNLTRAAHARYLQARFYRVFRAARDMRFLSSFASLRCSRPRQRVPLRA